jgi:hypothetical protein
MDPVDDETLYLAIKLVFNKKYVFLALHDLTCHMSLALYARSRGALTM